MKIDADSHIFPEEAFKIAESQGERFRSFFDEKGREFCYTPRGTVRPWGKIWYDLDLRLAAMRDAGFDKQVLICDNGFAADYVSLETSMHLSRAYNDSVAKLQKEHEEFIGCADVPHQEPDAAIAEAKRAINDLNLKAIRIFGSWCGKNIESYEWWPFFETVNELKVPLLLHPNGAIGDGDVNPNLLGSERFRSMSLLRDSEGRERWWPSMQPCLLGFTFDAMIVIAGLVMKGVLKQYPNLRVGILESGGPTLALLMSDRLDLVHESDKALLNGPWKVSEKTASTLPITTKPSEYIRKHFWFALDHVSAVEVPLLVREFGMSKRLLTQTDFPHEEGSLDTLRWVERMDISESDKENIAGKNAAELLRLA